MAVSVVKGTRITALTNKQIGNYFNISDSAVGKAGKKVVGLLKGDKRLKKEVDEIFSVFRV